MNYMWQQKLVLVHINLGTKFLHLEHPVGWICARYKSLFLLL